MVHWAVLAHWILIDQQHHGLDVLQLDLHTVAVDHLPDALAHLLTHPVRLGLPRVARPVAVSTMVVNHNPATARKKNYILDSKLDALLTQLLQMRAKVKPARQAVA